MFKTKKVRELENRIAELESENETLKDNIASERICGNQCRICANVIETEKSNMMGYKWTEYDCKLDIKCKDFKEVKEHE